MTTYAYETFGIDIYYASLASRILLCVYYYSMHGNEDKDMLLNVLYFAQFTPCSTCSNLVLERN